MPHPNPSPGPIAQEVVRALQDNPLPIKPTEVVPVAPGPNSAPFQVRDKAVPLFGSSAWWFQKGGPIGVICFLVVGSFAWMGNSQRESTNALVGMMEAQQRASNEERKELTKVILNTQAEISANMARLARSFERLEQKLDRKDGP